MNRKLIFAGTAVLSLMISIAVVDSVYALAGSDPNAARRSTVRNFRRSVGLSERYRRNKRSLERRYIDRFTSASGSINTFHRRENYLREAYDKRFKADLESRKYSGINRPEPKYRFSNTRYQDSTLRRIRRAERGGIRLRSISSKQSGKRYNAQDRRDLSAAYRKHVVDKQIQRYSEMDNVDCALFSGRRQAFCYYKQRRRD